MRFLESDARSVSISDVDAFLNEVGSTPSGAGSANGTKIFYAADRRWRDRPKQFRGSFAPDRGDNAELGEVRSDRINHRGLLAYEQMACAVKHQAALLLRCLCWHEPHVGSGDRLANRLSVGHVVLMPFDVGLYISWWH